MIEINDFVVYYTVPKSKEAMDTWIPGMTDFENYEHYEVSERLNNTLWEIYNRLNQCFNIIIDACEDEVLQYNDLSDALTIINEYINALDNDEQKSTIEMLQMAIKSAIKYKTCLFFDF